MPNSNVRLTKLFSEFGFNTDEGSISNAEIESYACGIKLIEDDFGVYLKRIFPSSMIPQKPSEVLYEYMELMGEYVEMMSSFQDIVGSRIGGPWGWFTKQGMDKLLYQIHYSTKYEIKDGKMIFTSVGNDTLIKMGHFIRGYVPANLTPDLSGMKCCFSYWEKWKKKWYYLDKMGMPFNVIEEMRVDLYK